MKIRQRQGKPKPFIKLSSLSPRTRHILNAIVTVASAMLCLLLLPLRLPGMELLGISPNWLLIWVVAWSIKRNVFQAAVAGLALGWIQDGMTGFEPSHALSLMLVAIVTARIQKHRFIQEDFISVALMVFAMTVLADTVTAIQYFIHDNLTHPGGSNWSRVWLNYQRIALASAIVSSLWAPVVYYPLNRWWQGVKVVEKSS